jgi:hypothetical protein
MRHHLAALDNRDAVQVDVVADCAVAVEDGALLGLRTSERAGGDIDGAQLLRRNALRGASTFLPVFARGRRDAALHQVSLRLG